MPEAQIIEIDVDQLEPDPTNVRSTYDAEVIQGLAAFFKDQGTFIENPVVWKAGQLEDGRPLYRAFSGSTRAQAARRVGGKIVVQLLPYQPEGSSKLLGQLAAGLVKGDLNPVDIGRALRTLQEDGRRSVQDLVRELADWGMRRSRSWVFQHLHLLDLVPEVQAMISKGELPVGVVNILHKKRPDEQLRIAEAIRDGSVRLNEVDQDRSPELIQAEVLERIAGAASAPDQVRRQRQASTAERQDGPVQSRRLLLGLDSPEQILSRGRRPTLPAGPIGPDEWAAGANQEQRALAREALHLGKLTVKEAVEAVNQWMAEAETAPDDLLLAAHGLKRLIDLHTRHSETLVKYPGLMRLLQLRAAALTRITELAQKRASRS
jgi:hypothetical protein